MSTDLEAEILDRIRALDDSDRRRVLNFLSGCVPEAVAAALDWIDLPAAAQATEDNLPDIDREALTRLEAKRAEWNDRFTAHTLLTGPPEQATEDNHG